ncbi:hypothetical protein ABGT15_04550 [Flavobacterium enshiense]|uniref:hypothetical protein n=1 Tax=Flavobacterium enshiense TaxID=1341165 RepID=UPI00345D4A03
MQVFQTTSNPNTFKYNGLTYPKNFMCIKQGDTNIAIHNAYDTRFQLLGSTHYNQFQVDGVVPSSQANLMAVLSTLIFSKQFNYITQVNGGNQLISIGSITVDTNYVTIEPAEWIINGLTYQTTINTVLTVPYAATDKNRIDLIVATDTNELIRIEGDETSGIAVAPVVPLNTIYVTQIAINDNSIGEPEEPTLGDLYIPKDEKRVTRIVYETPISFTNFGIKDNTIFVFENNVNGIHSFTINPAALSSMYDGKEYVFINGQASNITFYHDSPSGTGAISINTIDGNDFVLEPNQAVRFFYRTYDSTFIINRFSSSSGSLSLDDVVNNGNITDIVISGNNGYTTNDLHSNFEIATNYTSGTRRMDWYIEGDNVDYPTSKSAQFRMNLDEYFSFSSISGATSNTVGVLPNETRSNKIVNGLEGFKTTWDYGNYEVGTPYSDNCKKFIFSTFGDDIEYLSTQGATVTINPEEVFFKLQVDPSIYAQIGLSTQQVTLYGHEGVFVKGNGTYNARLRTTNLTAQRNFEFPNVAGTLAISENVIAKHDGATYDTNAIQTLTQAEYNAISGSTNAGTLYFII